MKNRLILTALYVFGLLSFQAFSQTDEVKTEIVKAEPYACETNSALSDGIAIEANAKDEKVFIIFRAGNGEGTKTNSRRLRIVRDFLRIKGWTDSERFIFAKGEKVKGQGRVEFYLGSKLYFVALAKKGRIPCMDCCGFDFDSGKF